MKLKNLVTKYKTEILMVLTALISFFTTLGALGGKAAVYSTIIIALIELIIYYLKNGLTEVFLNMCVATVKMIVDVVNGVYTKEVKEPEPEKVEDGEEEPKKASRRKKIKVCMLTEDMIREKLENQ